MGKGKGKDTTSNIGKSVARSAAPERIIDPERLHRNLKITAEDRLGCKMHEIIDLLWLPEHLEAAEVNARLARAIELYESLAPADGAEAMLAAQMVGTHHAALECLRRAALPGQSFEGRDLSLKHAAKLMALYETQFRTLQKSKGKGQQKVTVEHVHVEAGGQAIVGNVQTGSSEFPEQGPDMLEKDRSIPPLSTSEKQKERR